MKKYTLVLLIAAFFMPPCLHAQNENTTTQVSNYIFQDFLPGIVRKKSGELVRASLNYNTISEEMMFIRDSQKLVLAQLEDIDTVYVGGRVFIPVEGVFYEKATQTPVALFIQHKAAVLPPGKDIGYGIKSSSGAVSSATDVRIGNKSYRLDVPEGSKIVSRTVYWVKKKDRFIKLTSFKKIEAIFSARAGFIKEFLKDNNIKLDNDDDMIKLILYCNLPAHIANHDWPEKEVAAL